MKSTAQAVAQAQQLLGLSPSTSGIAWPVRRLDGQGVYFLVHVDNRVACIDAFTGALLVSADAVRTPVAIAPDKALALAPLGAADSAELVWKPCAATRSMLDPLWSVAGAGRTVFVDQRGKVWPTLPPLGPGGAPGQPHG